MEEIEEKEEKINKAEQEEDQAWMFLSSKQLNDFIDIINDISHSQCQRLSKTIPFTSK